MGENDAINQIQGRHVLFHPVIAEPKCAEVCSTS
jgi:hypothetical protein